jgi:hypothetical protein
MQVDGQGVHPARESTGQRFAAEPDLDKNPRLSFENGFVTGAIAHLGTAKILPSPGVQHCAVQGPTQDD